MKPNHRRPFALAAALAALIGLAWGGPAQVAAPATAPSLIKKVTKVAPGLSLTRIIDKRTPRRIFVLTADLSAALTLDPALAGTQMPARARTSIIAKRAGALAAVNGDFGSQFGGPTHPFAMDGELIRTSMAVGNLLAWSKDEQNVFIDRPAQLVTATEASGLTWTIDRWNNGPPGVGEIAAFSPVGGSLQSPPAAACSARMLPASPIAPATGSPGLVRTYTVDQTGCFELAMPRSDGVVLSALPATDEATRLLALVPGASVAITWSFGWQNVFDAIGGSPLLLANGSDVVGECTASVCNRNPRTGVGITAAGKVLLVVVDGRQSKWSIGVTLHQFAGIFRNLGAVWALNLDGGGSSTMVVRGDVVNRPSEGFERSIATALLVLPGPDPNEP